MERSSVRRAIVAIVATGVAAIGATSVSAQSAGQPTDPRASAVSQYLEMVPTARGPNAPGVGEQRQSSLSRTAENALQAADPETAGVLKKIATSSAYGAPNDPTPNTSVGPPLEQPQATTTDVRTTIEAIASTNDTRLVGLLVVVLLTTLSAIALAVGRTRA